MEITIHESFSDFSEAEWNAINAESGDFVFADHRFLTALERSGSLGRRTGWFPQILAARVQGRLVAALPAFLKTNSYGEYIFDWAWANAAEQAGLEYYPKLVVAIPFTPATGPKFLGSSTEARDALMHAALQLNERASSSHFLFETTEEARYLQSRAFSIRHSYQYHWRNRNWQTFTDFLGALRSKRRSEIKRERDLVSRSDLKIERLTGAQLTREHAEIMAAFYLSTIRKMGGHAYLSRGFFIEVFETLKDSILFVLASDKDGRPVAGALNFYRDRSLFGRYWGCLDEFKNLHFEVCYYQAIEWALANRIELFEAGAQGEHKFNRGFTPSLTLSAHKLNHPGLQEAVDEFLEHEKTSIAQLFSEYREHDPFQRLSAP